MHRSLGLRDQSSKVILLIGMSCSILLFLEMLFLLQRPRYRVELQKRCTWMGIREPLANETASAQTEKVKSDEA